MEIDFDWRTTTLDSDKKIDLERLLKLQISSAAERCVCRNFSSIMVSIIEESSPPFQITGFVFAQDGGERKELMQLEFDGEFFITCRVLDCPQSESTPRHVIK